MGWKEIGQDEEKYVKRREDKGSHHKIRARTYESEWEEKNTNVRVSGVGNRRGKNGIEDKKGQEKLQEKVTRKQE